MLKAILFSFLFGTVVGSIIVLFGNLTVLVFQYSNHQQSERATVYDDKPLLDAPNMCPGVLRLAVLIFSAPGSLERRQALRDTWIRDANTSEGLVVELKFLVGIDGLNESDQTLLIEERETYGDMLLFDDVLDSFTNLTIKLLKGMEWAHKHLTFDYLMKTDDDCYVRLDKIGAAIRRLKCLRQLFMGYFIGGAWPRDAGKYIETKWFMCQHYINYASGAGYVLSKEAVNMVIRYSDKLFKRYNNDDVSIAVWLAPYDLVRVHDMRLDFRIDDKPACNKHYLVSHRHNTQTLHKYYDRIHNNKNICPWREGLNYRYLYQWHTNFDQCCKGTRMQVNDDSFSVLKRIGKVL